MWYHRELLGVEKNLHMFNNNKAEQDPMILASILCPLPAFCLWKILAKELSLIKEVRKDKTKENNQRRSNNNNVVTKNSQGPLVPSKGL